MNKDNEPYKPIAEPQGKDIKLNLKETLHRALMYSSERNDLKYIEDVRHSERMINKLCSKQLIDVVHECILSAAVSGNPLVLREFLKFEGCDINYINKHGDTALTIAAFGRFGCVEEILKHDGVLINHMNRDCKTAKMIMAGFVGPISYEVQKLIEEYEEKERNRMEGRGLLHSFHMLRQLLLSLLKGKEHWNCE